jgi:hypothetical protein
LGVGGRKRKQKREKNCGCKGIEIKEKPTHFKDVDGERLFESH